MSSQYTVQPDLTFIDEVISLGGDTLKKCFQCATCSVACPIAPENSPFPRKEMIAAGWGLKDKLVGSADIWLCHECGDCTVMCPRGAKPGATLSAIRSYAINEYAGSAPVIGKLAKVVKDPKKLALLTVVPAVWLALMAFVTMVLGKEGGILDRLFGFIGLHWIHHTDAPIAQARFISSWLVDLTFIPVFTASILVFVYTLRKMLTDMHANAVAEGKTDKDTLDYKEYAKKIPSVISKVLKHSQFNECGENKNRGTAHMMVLYGFIGCFIVTAIGFIFLYGIGKPGPYSQWWPFKWLGNISGIAIVFGAILMIKERIGKPDLNAYKDWYLLGLVLTLGATGLLTQMARLAGMQFMTYAFYYVHLIAVFHLFTYLPFSKLAHAVYRLAAMTYAEYANRK